MACHAYHAYAVQLGQGYLIQSAVGESSCSAKENVASEDAYPCACVDCEDWDENWLSSLNVDNPNSDTEEVDYDLLATATTQINIF